MRRFGILLALCAVFVASSARANPLGTLTSNNRIVQVSGAEGAVNSTSVADYFPFNGVFTPAAAAAEGNELQTASIGGTVSNLNCWLTVAGGTKTVAGGTSYVIAFRDNQSDTTLTCTILAAASGCTDTTHSVTVAAGDQLDFGSTPSGTPTALEAHCSAVFAY
jgi:hypothetical protein